MEDHQNDKPAVGEKSDEKKVDWHKLKLPLSVAVALLIGGLAGWGLSQQELASLKDQNTEIQSQIDSFVGDKVNDEDNLEESKEVGEQEGSAPQDNLEVGLNETATSGDHQITVTRIHREPTEYAGFTYGEASGNPEDVLVIDFTIVNKGSSIITYTYEDFSFQNSEGLIMNAQPIDMTENTWQKSKVSAGGEFSAKVFFETKQIPEDVGLVLWQPSGVTDDQIVKVSL